MEAAAQTIRYIQHFPLHVSIMQRASCGGHRRWWGKAGNVTPTKKLSSCTDCFLYKQRESVVVTNTYWKRKKKTEYIQHEGKERKGKETLKYEEK
jgi:hypothetical protein